MRFLSFLVILLAAAVVSLSGSQAKTVNEIPGSTNKTELGPHKNPTDSGDAKWEAIYLMINSRIVNI